MCLFHALPLAGCQVARSAVDFCTGCGTQLLKSARFQESCDVFGQPQLQISQETQVWQFDWRKSNDDEVQYPTGLEEMKAARWSSARCTCCGDNSGEYDVCFEVSNSPTGTKTARVRGWRTYLSLDINIWHLREDKM